MKEHPILFSGPMVRAILDGLKTQTRRVIKPTMTTPRVAPLRMEPWLIDGEQETDDNDAPLWAGFHPDYPGEAKWFSCPYGQPGDRLWVRETWQARSPRDLEWSCYKPIEREGYQANEWSVRYAATDENFAEWSGWNPSIHMPHWASRLTMEITGVRVERVADISHKDAHAEGMRLEPGRDTEHLITDFRSLWDEINGARVGCSWHSNPWVWVVEFRRMP